jgi:hypothetical protein
MEDMQIDTDTAESTEVTEIPLEVAEAVVQNGAVEV